MSATGWFYVQDDKRQGPVDMQHIVRLVVTAVLPPSTLVWHQGLTEWTEADRVPEIAALLPPPLPPGKRPGPEPPPVPPRRPGDRTQIIEKGPEAPAPAGPAPGPPGSRIEDLRQRLQKEPNPRLFAQLAEELRKAGELEEAIRVCREGVERSPSYPSLHVTLGRALLEQGDLPAARSELEAVLQAAPDNIMAERALGECLEAMGDRAGARARYLKALALAPGDPQLVARLRSLHGGDGPSPGAATPANGPTSAPLPEPAPVPAPARAAAAPAARARPEPAVAESPPPRPAPALADSDPLAGVLDAPSPVPEPPPAQEAEEPAPEARPDPPPIPLVQVDEAFEIERAGDVGAVAAPAPKPAAAPKRKPPPAAASTPAIIVDAPSPPGNASAGPPAIVFDAAPPPPPVPHHPGRSRATSPFTVPKDVSAAAAATSPIEPTAFAAGAVAWPTGRLADHEFADLVAEVYQRHWSGLLTLNHMGVEKSMRVKDGRLVFAFSSSRDDRLGELLLRRGRITLHQYVEASRAIRKGVRLGTVLVEQGALDARDLVKVVMDHTQEIIYSAFQWTEGLYHFTEGGEATEPITLKISTPDVILEGLRRIESWSRIERAVGGMETRYTRTPGYEEALGHMTLSLEKLSILTGLDFEQDVGAICRSSTLSHFEVCRTLWAFKVIGVVRRLD